MHVHEYTYALFRISGIMIGNRLWVRMQTKERNFKCLVKKCRMQKNLGRFGTFDRSKSPLWSGLT